MHTVLCGSAGRCILFACGCLACCPGQPGYFLVGGCVGYIVWSAVGVRHRPGVVRSQWRGTCAWGMLTQSTFHNKTGTCCFRAPSALRLLSSLDATSGVGWPSSCGMGYTPSRAGAAPALCARVLSSSVPLGVPGCPWLSRRLVLRVLWCRRTRLDVCPVRSSS